MIKEYKLNKDTNKNLRKSLVKIDARKKNIKNKQHKHIKQNYKKTKKNIQHIQHGGNKNKEEFEITTLNNVNPNKFSISQYINANVDWGIMPGPPPTDCCIM